MQGAAEEGSRDGWTRAGKEMAQDVMCEEWLEGAVGGLGRRQGWLVWGTFVVLCVGNEIQTEISHYSGFFFSTGLSFPMGKKQGKRRERVAMAGGKENGRDVTVTEKWG